MIVAYPEDLSNFHEITHSIGLQMSWYYNDIGKIALDVPASDYNINALEVGGLIYDSDHDIAYTIQHIKYDTSGNRITVNGYTANWLLNKRSITSKATISNVESSILQVVSSNLRSLPDMTVAPASGLTATSTAILYGGELLDGIMPVLDDAEYGHRVSWDSDEKTFVFSVYQGNDLTSGIHAVIFSEEQGTAAKLSIDDDNSTFKNYFYLPCTLLNGTKIVVEYGSATGGDRYEHWIESEQSQEEDETEENFRKRMKWECQAEMSQRLRRQSFSVEADASDLGVAYNLGDKIACASVRFGVEFLARITGIKFTLDSNGPKTQLVLGEPKLTVLEELKLNV